MALRKWWIVCFALALALLVAPTIAWSDSGKGGGDDSDDQETADNSDDSSDDSADDNSGSDSGSDDDNSGSGDSSDDDSSSGSGSGDDDSSSDHSGSGSGSGDDGDGDHSGSSEGGSSGSGSSEHSGHSERSGSSRDDDKSGRGHGEAKHDSDDRIEIVSNDDGERVRAGEAVLLSKEDVSKRLADDGFRVIESFRLDAIGSTAVRVAMPEGMSQRQMLDALRKVDPTGIATFNHIYDPAGVVAAPRAQTNGTAPISANGARVGLIDARVDAKHPLLRQVTVTARAFDVRASVAEHGTAVASRIAEVAPGAALYAANVFTVAGDGQEIATADAIARGLDWLAKMRVPVINLSLTGPANPILELMTARLCAQGHILVAAVGNEGPRGAPQYPAAYENVVGVTAVDSNNRVYLYANQGDYVDFAARGVDARVADHDGAVDTVSGTSYAAPVIAAKLARTIASPDVAKAKAALSALAAEARDLGAPGRDPVYGFGLIANQ